MSTLVNLATASLKLPSQLKKKYAEYQLQEFFQKGGGGANGLTAGVKLIYQSHIINLTPKMLP
jgi:hypothetical protein